MIPVKPADVANAGNGEVVKMLENWLDRAKQGRLAFAVIVACDGLEHVNTQYAGSLRYAFAANWGLDTAKYQLAVNLHGRHEEPFIPDSSAPDRVCWDISKGPACFDFIAWLIIAEMNRIRSGTKEPLKVSFKMTDSPEEHAKHATLRKGFYDNVIYPSLNLIGAVQDNSDGAPSLERYTLRPIVEFAKAGEAVPLLRPSDGAVKNMTAYLNGTTNGKAPVTITLREAPYLEYRNSDLTEWLRVAEYLEATGESVIFIRDTAKAAEPITGFQTCPAAATNLDTRMALYEAAKCNLFVSNGPWYLGLFGSKPWMMFIEPKPLNPSFPETPQFWSQWHGIDPGEQFPWCKPNQRIIWKRDTSDRIITEWNNLPL